MDNEHMLLELDHISKIYGDLHAVDDLSLTVPQGQWLAIVGSSGSGKTTLMNMIGCMDTPSKGSVMLEGRRLEDLNARQLADVRKNMIGLVFQKFYLVPHLTAVENVMVAQYYHSVVDEKQAMEALERVGLKERAHHLPGQLSGGEQQRVCIARALINDPEIVLADEVSPGFLKLGKVDRWMLWARPMPDSSMPHKPAANTLGEFLQSCTNILQREAGHEIHFPSQVCRSRTRLFTAMATRCFLKQSDTPVIDPEQCTFPRIGHGPHRIGN